MSRTYLVLSAAAVASAVFAAGWAVAQSGDHPAGGAHGAGPAQAGQMGPGRMGPGMKGMGRGMMGMGGGLATMDERQDIHALLMNDGRIVRTVTNLPNGIRTVTESDDPEIARTIQSHVEDMGARLEEGRDPGMPIESPALRSLFPARERIVSTYEATAKGYVVTQTSDDQAVVRALQDHAAEVSDLAERGMVAAQEAMMRNGGGMMRGGMMRGGAASPAAAEPAHEH